MYDLGDRWYHLIELEQILEIGAPLSAVAGGVAAEKPMPCANCGKPEAANRCGRCQSIVYCSRACQASHWKSGHKKMCREQPKLLTGSV